MIAIPACHMDLAADPAARQLAARMARAKGRKHPALADEFESAAMLGLAEAASTYDPGRRVPFLKHAARRICGALVDCQRAYLPMGFKRGGRSRMPKTASLDAGRHETDAGKAVSYLDMLESGEEPVDAGAAYQDEIAGATRGLTPREAQVVRLVYGRADCASQAGAARAMGVTESRVSQIHKAAMARMRERAGADIGEDNMTMVDRLDGVLTAGTKAEAARERKSEEDARVGGKIRERREELGYSRARLAELADYSYNYLYSLETARVDIGPTSLAKIAVALGCSPWDLDPDYVPMAAKPKPHVAKPKPVAVSPSGNLTDERRRIGGRIRMLRERKGLSQADFSRLLRVNPASMSGIESGKRYAGRGMLARMAVSLGIGVDEVIGNPTAPVVPESTPVKVDATGALAYLQAAAVCDRERRLAREVDAASAVAAALDGLDDAGVRRVLAFVAAHYAPTP